jgi:RNA polymerase sigma-70 factor (ECF subfamily)
MTPTPLSLLERLKRPKPDASDWHRLQQIYPPLIRSWLSSVPGLRDEADDLTQEVLVILFRELPAFERRRDGSFGAWMRQITANRIRAFRRARHRRPLVGLGREVDLLLAQLADANSDLARRWDSDHDKHVSQRLLTIVRRDFEPKTWKAFHRFALEGATAAEVARELGVSEATVIQAKYRVLKRLRQEAGELLE